MFSGHPNIRNALYLQPPHTHAAVFYWGRCVTLQHFYFYNCIYGKTANTGRYNYA